VPYGREISKRGKHVWCAFDGERFVCAGATVGEARRRYRAIVDRLTGSPGRPADGLPPPGVRLGQWKDKKEGEDRG
jgi:hypothetical protein